MKIWLRTPHPALIYRDEVGATSIEYALIATFVSIVILVAVSAIGVDVEAMFTSVANGFQ